MIGWVKQGGGGLVDFEVSNTGLKEVVGLVWFVNGDDICCDFVTSVFKLLMWILGSKSLMEKAVLRHHVWF